MIFETVDTQYLMAFLLRASVPLPLAEQSANNTSISAGLATHPDTVVLRELSALSVGGRESSTGSGIPVAPASIRFSHDAIARVTRTISGGNANPVLQDKRQTKSVHMPVAEKSVASLRQTVSLGPPGPSKADLKVETSKADSTGRATIDESKETESDDEERPEEGVARHRGTADAIAVTAPAGVAVPSIKRPGVFMPKKKRAETEFSPAALRVAMVVTKAPSEPLSVVQRTLLAMLSQVLDGRGGDGSGEGH